MQKIQSKRKSKNFTRNPIVLIIFFTFLVFFGVGIVNLLGKLKDTNKNKEIALNKLNNLEERRKQLLIDIENLNSEKGKEKVFRENYGYGKEGEGVISIVQDKENDTNEDKKPSFWAKIRSFFSW